MLYYFNGQYKYIYYTSTVSDEFGNELPVSDAPRKQTSQSEIVLK